MKQRVILWNEDVTITVVHEDENVIIRPAPDGPEVVLAFDEFDELVRVVNGPPEPE